MLERIRRWLFGGYTCDDCKRWTPRRRGRAYVRVERREYQMVKLDGTGTTQSYRAVVLRCPECASAWAVRQIEAAVRDALPTFEALLAISKKEVISAVA